jgi:integrase
VRQPGTREGLTRSQAERELRRQMERDQFTAATSARLTVEDAGERYLHHLEHVMGRAPSTVQDYRIMLARHLVPHLGGKALDRVEPDDVLGYMAAKRRAGLSPKTVQNHVTLLHGLMKWSVKRGWARTNPVAAVDRPPSPATDPDIRFLTLEELEGVIREVPDDVLGPADRTLYLTAAMTGLRQGELVALRWRDIDWAAGKVRVRRKRYRGRDGKPKSRRGSRAVPLADRAARALEIHFQRSTLQDDDDLVFPHPETGHLYDTSKMRKRFDAAVAKAGVRDDVKFHDLRHTFGTRMAAAGVPLRTLQEWMGHRDYKTTLIYADYMPDDRREAELVERAFAPSGTVSGTEPSETKSNSDDLKALWDAESEAT